MLLDGNAFAASMRYSHSAVQGWAEEVKVARSDTGGWREEVKLCAEGRDYWDYLHIITDTHKLESILRPTRRPQMQNRHRRTWEEMVSAGV
jgi:hypothetical protein